MSTSTGSPGPDARAPILPTGTVTFLVADVDPLTERRFGPAAGAWRPQLDRAVDTALSVHGGRRSETGSGDKVVAAFDSATKAVAAALGLREAVREKAELDALRPGLRIGLHTGDARARRGGRYIGAAERTSERLVEIANGGQTLVSAP